MADFSKIISHILKFEGGHSSDPEDNALRAGHTGILGGAKNPKTGLPYDARYPNNFIQTNKGIICATYKEYARRKKKTSSVSEFLEMPYNIWFDIYKTLFWDGIKGDKYLSQGISEHLLEALWGGGASILVIDFKRYLNKNFNTNLPVNGNFTDNFIEAINKNIKTRKRYEDAINFLYTSRLDYLKKRADWWKYKKGWTDRMNKTLKRTLEYKFPLFDFAFLFKLFAIGGGIFFLTRNMKN